MAHADTKVPSIPHNSTNNTINRRVNNLDIKINETMGNDIIIAIDSTDIKVSDREEWMRHKWYIRKGYLKIHVAVYRKKKKIISLVITTEEVHDGKMLKNLVDHALENNTVKRVLGDGSYDINSNFRYLSRNHIRPGIKTGGNSKVRPTNYKTRNMGVIRQKRNPEKWKRSVRHGYRWLAETIFSSMKRIFGKHVSAKKFPNMVKAMFLKVSLYNIFHGII